jgi:hypothetical protein
MKTIVIKLASDFSPATPPESANASIVGKDYVSKNKTNITILLLTNQCFFSIINDFNH